MPAWRRTGEAKGTSLEKRFGMGSAVAVRGHYQKPYAECVKFRSQLGGRFFEGNQEARFANKEEIGRHTIRGESVTGVRPFPADSGSWPFYGEIALGTNTRFSNARPDWNDSLQF